MTETHEITDFDKAAMFHRGTTMLRKSFERYETLVSLEHTFQRQRQNVQQHALRTNDPDNTKNIDTALTQIQTEMTQLRTQIVEYYSDLKGLMCAPAAPPKAKAKKATSKKGTA